MSWVATYVDLAPDEGCIASLQRTSGFYDSPWLVYGFRIGVISIRGHIVKIAWSFRSSEGIERHFALQRGQSLSQIGVGIAGKMRQAYQAGRPV